MAASFVQSSDDIEYQEHRRPYHSHSPKYYENNTAFFIFSFDVDGYSDGSVSLLINGFEYRVVGQEHSEQFRTGDMIISWTPTNKGKVTRAKVYDANQKEVGDISLSRYRMKLDLIGSEFTSVDDARKSLEVIMKDGSFLKYTGMSSSSISSNGDLGLSYDFQKLFPMDNVKSTELTGYTVSIQ
jgi:hypothetical protein